MDEDNEHEKSVNDVEQLIMISEKLRDAKIMTADLSKNDKIARNIDVEVAERLKKELIELLREFAHHELRIGRLDEFTGKSLVKAIQTSTLDDTTKKWLASEFTYGTQTADTQNTQWQQEYARSCSGSGSGSVQMEDAQAAHANHTQTENSESPHTTVALYSSTEFESWDFDVLELSVESCFYFAARVFQSFDLLNRFSINLITLNGFLTAIASKYKVTNEYHNFYHAIDVLHVIYCYLKHTNVIHLGQMRSLDILSLLIAAFCHDVAHPGLSNSFQIQSCSDLAFVYNDQSVLENFHAATTFQTLKQPELNILSGLSHADWHEARKLIISCILATDMAQHFNQVAALDSLFDRLGEINALNSSSEDARLTALDATKTNKCDKQIYRGRLSSSSVARSSFNLPSTPLFVCRDDVSLLMQVLLHSADVSNVTKPYKLAHKWSEKVHSEFLKQGDRERENGFTISPFMDRNNPNHSLLQMSINFIDFIVSPLQAALVQVFPTLEHAARNLISNRQTFHQSLITQLDIQINDCIDAAREAKEMEKQSLIARAERFHATFIEPFMRLENRALEDQKNTVPKKSLKTQTLTSDISPGAHACTGQHCQDSAHFTRSHPSDRRSPTASTRAASSHVFVSSRSPSVVDELISASRRPSVSLSSETLQNIRSRRTRRRPIILHASSDNLLEKRYDHAISEGAKSARASTEVELSNAIGLATDVIMQAFARNHLSGEDQHSPDVPLHARTSSSFGSSRNSVIRRGSLGIATNLMMLNHPSTPAPSHDLFITRCYSDDIREAADRDTKPILEWRTNSVTRRSTF